MPPSKVRIAARFRTRNLADTISSLLASLARGSEGGKAFEIQSVAS
jgi:hypothetical protein